MKVKLVEIVEELPNGEWDGKTIYNWMAKVSVDGVEHVRAVKTFSSKGKEIFESKAEMDAKSKTFRGQEEITVYPPKTEGAGGGGGGYKGKSPEERASIEHQVCFKGAVDIAGIILGIEKPEKEFAEDRALAIVGNLFTDFKRLLAAK